ncbi:hypothetical protein HY497_02195 [Candidatus Woesearchaeota archaeon]|nr:hypothetical protein [Candidatus Woesearchaeota archaeon]
MAKNNAKLVAVLSYITIIGWVISLIVHQENKTALGSFHLRQALLLMIVGLLAWIPMLGMIIGIVLVVFWIMGLVSAIQGKQKELPLIGHYAQEWFKGL